MDVHELQKKTVKETERNKKTKLNIAEYILDGGNMPYVVSTGINSLSSG